jgi:hypothetical protein
MSTRTAERLAAIDRLIDYLARLRGEFPDPEANWGSLIAPETLRHLCESGSLLQDLESGASVTIFRVLRYPWVREP